MGVKFGLRFFENGVRRGTFRYEREKVAGRWIKLYNEDMYNFYFHKNIIMELK
jgi:hypothetical protein